MTLYLNDFKTTASKAFINISTTIGDDAEPMQVQEVTFLLEFLYGKYSLYRLFMMKTTFKWNEFPWRYNS